MNLFWETRRLTQEREDHLTSFWAAALETDALFRKSYETHVLQPLAAGSPPPRITGVEIQVSFPDHRCQPDMVLELEDGRRVVCEHKLDAGETAQVKEDGETALQLERYLQLPGTAAVIYVRSALKPPSDAVLNHPRYLAPPAGPHFLWRDLYQPLLAGDQLITAWLRDGFERLGFTPPLPHIGELWPDQDDAIKENQRNFAKLWDSVRSQLSRNWRVGTGSRCELYLDPIGPSRVGQVYVSPLAQQGTLLRIRLSKLEVDVEVVRRALERVAVTQLPVKAEVVATQTRAGAPCVDLLSSLRLVLGESARVEEQEARLFAQVIPVVEALHGDA
jgi:hypothetical protein